MKQRSTVSQAMLYIGMKRTEMQQAIMKTIYNINMKNHTIQGRIGENSLEEYVSTRLMM